MKRLLKSAAIWVGLLAGLVLPLTLVPAANAIPNWLYVAGLLVVVTGIAVVSQRKRNAR